MKGFIEIHDERGNEFFVGIENICYVEHYDDSSIKGCRHGCIVGLKGAWVTTKETYEEVKALIAEAQGDVDTISKIELKNWVECEKERIENTPILNDREKGVRLGMLQELVEFLAKEEL